DDGEPSGTAGKPILEVLKKTGLTNAAIVVTRYFGGIKLGAGGLIRAYSHSASLAVQGAPKELHTSRTLLHVSLDYNQYGPMERFLQDQNLSFESSFGSQVELTIYVAPDQVESLSESIRNTTGGRALIKEGELTEVTLPYQDNL
ncbi:MAG: YigZ family protein, partial [Veillonella sp.]|nr:YigZ family protein [Veillonella sp.]